MTTELMTESVILGREVRRHDVLVLPSDEHLIEHIFPPVGGQVRGQVRLDHRSGRVIVPAGARVRVRRRG